MQLQQIHELHCVFLGRREESGIISLGKNTLNGEKKGQEEGQGRRKRLEKAGMRRSRGEAKVHQKSALSSVGLAEFSLHLKRRPMLQPPVTLPA